MGINKSQQLGAKAESATVQYFEQMGFEIVERNYRYKRAEIDLIVLNEEIMIFVEVKYRSNSSFGNPEEFVSENQQRSIVEAADGYIHAINWQKNIRFDIVAIDEGGKLEHFEDAFY